MPLCELNIPLPECQAILSYLSPFYPIILYSNIFYFCFNKKTPYRTTSSSFLEVCIVSFPSNALTSQWNLSRAVGICCIVALLCWWLWLLWCLNYLRSICVTVFQWNKSLFAFFIECNIPLLYLNSCVFTYTYRTYCIHVCASVCMVDLNGDSCWNLCSCDL